MLDEVLQDRDAFGRRAMASEPRHSRSLVASNRNRPKASLFGDMTETSPQHDRRVMTALSAPRYSRSAMRGLQHALQHAASVVGRECQDAERFTTHAAEVGVRHDGRNVPSFASFSRRRLPRMSRSRTLDVSGGAGRLNLPDDWQPLAGLDGSLCVGDAAGTGTSGSALVRADISRLPFRDAAFTLVVSLATSFNSFFGDSPGAEALKEVAHMARPGRMARPRHAGRPARVPRRRCDADRRRLPRTERSAVITTERRSSPQSPRAIFLARRVMLRGC